MNNQVQDIRNPSEPESRITEMILEAAANYIVLNKSGTNGALEASLEEIACKKSIYTDSDSLKKELRDFLDSNIVSALQTYLKLTRGECFQITGFFGEKRSFTSEFNYDYSQTVYDIKKERVSLILKKDGIYARFEKAAYGIFVHPDESKVPTEWETRDYKLTAKLSLHPGIVRELLSAAIECGITRSSLEENLLKICSDLEKSMSNSSK